MVNRAVLSQIFGVLVTFVLVVAAMFFFVLLATGIGKAGFWFVPGVIYLVTFLLALLAFAVKPAGSRSFVWFVNELLAPVALAGVAEALFVLGNDWLGYVAVGVAVLLMVVSIGHSILDVILGILVWFLAAQVNQNGWIYRMSKFVYGIFDRLWLGPVVGRRDDYDLCLLIRHAHPIMVIEKIIGRFDTNLIRYFAITYVTCFLGVPAIVILTSVVWPLVTNFRAFATAGIQINWGLSVGLVVLFQAIAILVALGDFVWTFWVWSWRRMHSGFLLFLSGVVITDYDPVDGNSFERDCPISIMHQVRRENPGPQPLGQEAKGLLRRWWDGYWGGTGGATSKLNVTKLVFPVTARQGMLEFDYCEYGDLVHSIFTRVAAMWEDLKALHPRGANAKVLMDPAGTKPNMLDTAMPSAYGQVDRLYELFLLRVSEMLGVPVEELMARSQVSHGGQVDFMALLLSESPPDIWCVPAALTYHEITTATGLTKERVKEAERVGGVEHLLAEHNVQIFISPALPA